MTHGELFVSTCPRTARPPNSFESQVEWRFWAMAHRSGSAGYAIRPPLPVVLTHREHHFEHHLSSRVDRPRNAKVAVFEGL